MTIPVATSGGETFNAQLEEDEPQCCGLTAEPDGRRMEHYVLSAVLKSGWRLVRGSPEEQARWDAHGFRAGEGRAVPKEL